VKTRGCFISNSSSSSFIIGVKGKLTKKKIMKAFRVGEDSPLYSFSEKMADVLLDATSYTKEEHIEDLYLDSEDEIGILEKKIFDKGYTFYSGCASDEDGGAESALCGMTLDYEDEEIIIYKEESY